VAATDLARGIFRVTPPVLQSDDAPRRGEGPQMDEALSAMSAIRARVAAEGDADPRFWR